MRIKLNEEGKAKAKLIHIVKDGVRYQLQKIHFSKKSAAHEAAHDGVAYAGERYMSGRIKTWIARVYVKQS